MKELEQLRKLLVAAMNDAAGVHKKDGDEWSAGRYDGLKQAVQILDQALRRPSEGPWGGCLGSHERSAHQGSQGEGGGAR